MKRWILSFGLLTSLLLLGACQQEKTNNSQKNTTKISQQSQSAKEDRNTSSSSQNKEATSNLDGTYQGQDEEETISLTIKNGKGQWTEQDSEDGEKEISKVVINEKDGTMTIGDEVKRYEIDGDQLILNDLDLEVDDTLVLVKTK